MSNKDLYIQLKEAYSDKNLNQITAGLLKLYKTRQFGSIRKISKIVSEFVSVDDEKINKCFSKLIMLYHPDKGEFYRNEIEINQLKILMILIIPLNMGLTVMKTATIIFRIQIAGFQKKIVLILFLEMMITHFIMRLN